MTGRMSSATNAGSDVAHEVFGNAKEGLSEAGDAVRKAARETVKEAASYGREQADVAYGAAQDAAKAAQETAAKVANTTARYVREKPVQAVLLGLGGLLLARLLFRRR